MITNPIPSYEKYIEDFFAISSPKDMKETLLYIYMHYLIFLKKDGMPNNFSMMAEDVFLLMDFLDEMQHIKNKKAISQSKEC